MMITAIRMPMIRTLPHWEVDSPNNLPRSASPRKIRERIERPDMQKSKKRCCVLCGAYAKTRTTARQTEPTVFRPRSTVSATEASQSVWTRPCCDTHSRVSREFRSSSRFLPNGKHNQRPNACVRYSRVLRKDFLYGSPSERDPIL